MKRRTKALWIGTIALSVLVGALFGRFALMQNASTSIPSNLVQVRANPDQYPFINPPLFPKPTKSTDPRLVGLSKAISSYIASTKSDSSVQSVSVYFRDMNDGQWTGVNEDELYAPSSMLKVLAMVAALKLAESDPGILSEKLYYQRNSENDPTRYEADDGLATGYYSLQTLIDYMIRYSDNDAAVAINSDPNIEASYAQIYGMFGLPSNTGADPNADYMSPKTFSVIFRSLYNSSIFGWSLSNQMLSLLSQTTFDYGLVAGLPASTTVAHKFGENLNQLHDCGIVYYSQDPYFLCVMTHGTDLNALESVISNISKLTWNYISQEKQQHS